MDNLGRIQEGLGRFGSYFLDMEIHVNILVINLAEITSFKVYKYIIDKVEELLKFYHIARAILVDNFPGKCNCFEKVELFKILYHKLRDTSYIISVVRSNTCFNGDDLLLSNVELFYLKKIKNLQLHRSQESAFMWMITH